MTKLDKKTSLIFLLSIIDNDLITTHNYQDILGYSRFVSHGTMPSKIHLAVDHLARASLRVVTFFFVRLFLCVNGRCIFYIMLSHSLQWPYRNFVVIFDEKAIKRERIWRKFVLWVLMRDIRIELARDMSSLLNIQNFNLGFFDGFFEWVIKFSYATRRSN